MDLERFIREAMRLPGVSGYEAGVGAYIAERFASVADSVEIDRMQNVIARVGNSGPKVMISAHQDEIGMMVLSIDDDGAIRMTPDGGVDPRILPGMEVEIQARKGPIYGVVGAVPPHVQSPEDQKKAIAFKDLHIDIGYPAETVRELVRVGDPIVMLADPVELSGGCMACKTMDDRASVAAMLVAAEELKRMKINMQVYFVASCQEEVGANGARAAANGIDPDWAIAIDVTHGEGPGTGKFDAYALDKVVIERGPLVHRALGKKLEETAHRYHIPMDIEVSGSSTGTDTDVIQTAHGGIPSVLISIPLRYMHTTVETLRLDTVREAGRLMALMIAEMSEEGEGFEWC